MAIRNQTRRCFLQRSAGATAAAGIAATWPVAPASAAPEAMQEAIRAIIGEAELRQGKVALDIPPLVENGNTIAMSVNVDSPMTEKDHVKAVHVFNEKNPQPNIVSVHFGPQAGKAAFSTRIRLADSQNVVAIAEMSDGSLWSDTVEVIVTIAACLEYN